MGLFDMGSDAIAATDFADIMGKNASKDAIEAQKNAANQSAAMQWQMYQQQRADLQPWREAGTKSLEKMQGDDYMKDFSMADFQADPGYAFRMAEGQKALERSASARGNMFGGAQAKALTKYGQDMGAQEYQASYDRFNADRDRRFGRLNTMSSGGMQAAGGMSAAAKGYGDTMTSNYIGMANAEGAAKIGASNQAAGMFGQAAGMFAMCDERLKTDIKPISQDEIKEFRENIRPKLFRYINEKHGSGEFAGPMAQDLEKSALGRRIVFENHKGEKAIDIGKAVMLLLAIEGVA